MTTKTPMELADEIERWATEDWSPYRHQIIAALRQSARREPVTGEDGLVERFVEELRDEAVLVRNSVAAGEHYMMPIDADLLVKLCESHLKKPIVTAAAGLQKAYEMGQGEAASRISELSRRVGELNADRIQFAREWQSAEALAKANQEDAENFRYLEGIIEWKPKAYDGCSYGRFDLMWPNEESDLRKAIQKGAEKMITDGDKFLNQTATKGAGKMSIERCEKHDLRWDSDSIEGCPACLEQVVSIEDKYRKIVEKRLTESSLALFKQMGAPAFMLPIKNTTPPLFIVVGEVSAVENLIKQVKPVGGKP